VIRTYSVVIPTYNSEKTIEACLTSVLTQSLPALEVLVVDDYSCDSTETVVRQCESMYAAAGIKLQFLCLAQNAGPSIARNKGINIAEGDFIAFLDSDDIWHNDKLAIIDRFLKDTPAGLVFHDYTEKLAFSSDTRKKHYDIELWSIYRLLLCNPAQTSCVVVRKQLATMFFDEAMRHCEDYDLWMRIAEDFSVYRLVGDPLTRLGRPQLSAGGLSSDRVAMRIAEMRVCYNFSRRAWLTRGGVLPILLCFSLLKFMYSYLRRCV